jgi:hypothetical protein
MNLLDYNYHLFILHIQQHKSSSLYTAALFADEHARRITKDCLFLDWDVENKPGSSVLLAGPSNQDFNLVAKMSN